jgi:hypothetical protein
MSPFSRWTRISITGRLCLPDVPTLPLDSLSQFLRTLQCTHETASKSLEIRTSNESGKPTMPPQYLAATARKGATCQSMTYRRPAFRDGRKPRSKKQHSEIGTDEDSGSEALTRFAQLESAQFVVRRFGNRRRCSHAIRVRSDHRQIINRIVQWLVTLSIGHARSILDLRDGAKGFVITLFSVNCPSLE